MSNIENDKLMEEFWDECTTQWRCPYCGDPVSEEWPVCCSENHGTEMLLSPCEEYVLRQGPYEEIDKEETAKAFEAWLAERGES